MYGTPSSDALPCPRRRPGGGTLAPHDDDQEDVMTTVREHVAQRMMEVYGFGDRDAWPLEWDPDNETSQYAILLDLAGDMVDATVEAINAIEDPGDGDGGDADAPGVGLLLHADGDTTTIATVRGWLAAAEALGLPDEAPVLGTISVSVPLPDRSVGVGR
jgi:hypothetical protein